MSHADAMVRSKSENPSATLGTNMSNDLRSADASSDDESVMIGLFVSGGSPMASSIVYL